MVKVKQNQTNLYKLLCHAVLLQKIPAYSVYEHCEKGHGRHTKWIVSAYSISDFACYDNFKIKVIPQWAGLKTVIAIRRIVEHTDPQKAKKDSDKVSFAISDLQLSAENFFYGIKGHWAIETMHRDRDLVFNEDNNRIKNHNLATVMAVFVSFAINFLHTFFGKATTDAKTLFGDNFKELLFSD